MKKEIKLRYVWGLIILAFIIAIVLICILPQTTGDWTTVVRVSIIALFILITLGTQYASFKAFRYKAKKIKYEVALYDTDVTDYYKLLKNNKNYDERKLAYGYSFLKIVDKAACRVLIVNDCQKYYNHEEDNTNYQNKKLEPCDVYVSFELFLDYDEQTLARLPDYSIQGQKVYFTAFQYIDGENKFKCLNVLEPDDQFTEAYNSLINDLGFRKIEN